MKKYTLLLVIILLGLILRIQTVSNKELWYDEAFSAEIVKNSYYDVFLLSKLDVHPPLYYFILKTYTLVFGNSELALRTPSIILGVLLIPLVYLLVCKLTSNTYKALISSAVISVNPFLVTYSREARSYSLLALLTVLALYLLIRSQRENKHLLLMCVLPMLFLTHYISVFILIPISIYFFSFNKKSLLFLLPLIIVVMIWTPQIIKGSASTGLKWIPDFTLFKGVQSIHSFVLGTDTNEPRVAPPLNPFPLNSSLVSIVIFIAVSIIIINSKPTKETHMLLVMSVLPILLVAVSSRFLGFNLYVERFMIGYGTLLLIYITITAKSKYFVFPYIILCIYISMTFIPKNIGYRELAQHYSDKPIVMTDATDYITAKYYLDGVKLQQGNWEEWVIIHQEDIFDEKKYTGSYYLVNRGPLEEWQPAFIVGEFYFYEWDSRFGI